MSVPAVPKDYVGHWTLRAACREHPRPDVFWPEPERDSPEQIQRRTAAAKQVCATCPVIIACREYALDAREPAGIWGGLTHLERVKILSLRRRHPGQGELAV